MERRATASNSRNDVVMDAGEQSGSGAESGWSGVSDNSSTDSECTIKTGLTQPMRRSVDLSAGLYDIDTTRLADCVTWCICLAIGHWRG